MKQEYDFSKAVRGKFFREGAELQLPIESLRHLRRIEDKETQMSSYTIYALKPDKEGNWAPCIYSSLKKGESRFGWSRIETADLRKLRDRIEDQGWDSLSEEEGECYGAACFLLDIEENDYVVHINVPEWGKCTLARVTKPYSWRFKDSDFNHRIPVDPTSVKVFDRNDRNLVHPRLSRNLKLQGRYWRVGHHAEFDDLLKNLGDKQRSRDFLWEDVREPLTSLAERIYHASPGKDLEPLVQQALERIPGVRVVERKSGRGDKGADLLVYFQSGLPMVPGLERESLCLVQVKSYEGELWDTRAVNDIRRALDYYPDADMALIASTAIKGSSALDEGIEKLQQDRGKPVVLLIGAELAAFLAYWADLATPQSNYISLLTELWDKIDSALKEEIPDIRPKSEEDSDVSEERIRGGKEHGLYYPFGSGVASLGVAADEDGDRIFFGVCCPKSNDEYSKLKNTLNDASDVSDGQSASFWPWWQNADGNLNLKNPREILKTLSSEDDMQKFAKRIAQGLKPVWEAIKRASLDQ